MDDDDRRRDIQREEPRLNHMGLEARRPRCHAPGPLSFEEAPTTDGVASGGRRGGICPAGATWGCLVGQAAATSVRTWGQDGRANHPQAIHRFIHSPFRLQTVRVGSNSGHVPRAQPASMSPKVRRASYARRHSQSAGRFLF